MRLLIISGSKSLGKANQYFVSEGKKLFDSVLLIPLTSIRVELDGKKPRAFYKNTDLTKFDACLPRLFAEDFVFGEVVLDILQNSGVYMPTTAEAYQISNHKYYMSKALSEISIPIPDSALCVGTVPAVKIAEKMGYPIVVKMLSGFGGKGVMFASSKQEFTPILDTLQIFKEFIVLQKFVESGREDLRCYVVGKDIHAVKRMACEGDLRSNVSRGGRPRLADFPEDYRDMVLNSAKIAGAELCAVDLIMSGGKAFVVEVNFTPGIMVKYFGPKFAKIFLKFIYKRAKEKKMVV
ncbi:MAG: ATP-grasp domain-containing protein [Candidatus Diapherotrites archaeon]